MALSLRYRKLLVAVATFYAVWVPSAILLFPPQDFNLGTLAIIVIAPITFIPLLALGSLESPLMLALLVAVFFLPAALFYYGFKKVSDGRLSMLLIVAGSIVLAASALVVMGFLRA